jgi:hypothetical protein
MFRLGDDRSRDEAGLRLRDLTDYVYLMIARSTGDPN